MYSWEIEQFLKDRNYNVGGDDLTFITDTRRHPQIKHIVFNPYDSTYDMWDKDGKHFRFNAMSYAEAKEKGLIRRKNDEWER